MNLISSKRYSVHNLSVAIMVNFIILYLASLVVLGYLDYLYYGDYLIDNILGLIIGSIYIYKTDSCILNLNILFNLSNNCFEFELKDLSNKYNIYILQLDSINYEKDKLRLKGEFRVVAEKNIIFNNNQYLNDLYFKTKDKSVEKKLKRYILVGSGWF